MSVKVTLLKQCTAVRTWEGVIKDPPQNGCLLWNTDFKWTNPIWNSWLAEDKWIINKCNGKVEQDPSMP